MAAFMDVDDSSYVKSFDLNQLREAVQFFNAFGFVVWRDIFDEGQCTETCKAMWNGLAASFPGICADDPSTWGLFKSSGKYGLSTRGPSFDPALVANRQNPKLIACIAAVLGIPIDDVMTSHDRYTIYRATELSHLGLDGSEFKTGRENIHIDLNPWWYLESNPDVVAGLKTLQYRDPQDFIKENNFVVGSMGRHVQCILNFSDNVEEDGGTLVVPGFHRTLQEWTSTHIHLKKPLPWVTFPSDTKNGGGPLEVEQELLQRAFRISMRAGSVLMWDQTVAHGTRPNSSSRCRTAQFLKAFSRRLCFASEHGLPPRHTVQEEVGDNTDGTDATSVPVAGHLFTPQNCRLLRRAQALERELRNTGALDIVTPLGRSAFGLDVLPAVVLPAETSAAVAATAAASEE